MHCLKAQFHFGRTRTRLRCTPLRSRVVLQNLVSMVITKEQQTTVLALIAQILQILDKLLSLEPEERRYLTNMGVGSDRFVRIVYMSLRQNPGIVPPNFDVEEYGRDVESLDMLLPIAAALQQLLTRVEDTRTALGSDLIVAANRGYALMQANGNADGMEEALKEASYRYAKNRRKPKKDDDGEK